MKTFIFYKWKNGVKATVHTVSGFFTKNVLREYYKNILDFDGIDSVNI